MNRNILIAVVALLAIAGLIFALTRKDAAVPTSPAASLPSATSSASASTAAAAPMPTTEPEPAVIDPKQIKPLAGRILDVATVALEAKMISNAESLLAAGKPRDALKQIEEYERVPDRAALVPEAEYVKIEALARVPGRRADALALASQARTDPEMEPFRERIEASLVDAGVAAPTSPSP